MKYPDIVSGLFWLVIGLGLSIWTLTCYEIGRLTRPGTGYLALALGILLILLSLIQLVGQMKQIHSAEEAVPDDAGFGEWKKVVYSLLILMVAALFFEQAGYLLTLFLMIVLLMKACERQSWKRTLITAVLTTAGVYVLFILLLDVQLPRGFLGV